MGGEIVVLHYIDLVVWAYELTSFSHYKTYIYKVSPTKSYSFCNTLVLQQYELIWFPEVILCITILCIVWLLQAPNGVWVRVCEWDDVEPRRRTGWFRSRLHQMEQRPRATMLCLWLLQSWCIGQPQEKLEKSLCHQHRCDDHSCHLLRDCLCCFQEQSQDG